MKRKKSVSSASYIARAVVTYSGAVVGIDFGAPTIVDIAIQCMRQVRFSGSLKEWWPVGMHQMLTANIVDQILGRPDLILDALLHDSPEAILGDTPSPHKTDERRAHENAILKRTYESLNIPLPSKAHYRVIKQADMLSLSAESLELGHQAFTSMLCEIKHIAQDGDQIVRARHIMQTMWKDFNQLEALRAEGRHVNEYRDCMFHHILYRLRP